MNKIKHIYQPDAISCGPTCLLMVYNSISNRNITIEDIKKIVGTDNIKGTTLDDMIIGLNHLQIKFDNPVLQNEAEAIAYLNTALINKTPVIIRTLTKGEKHWIVATEFNGLYYELKDPWLGEIKYTKQELISIWKPRDFHCLHILEQSNKENVNQSEEKNFCIRKFQEGDKEQVMKLMIKAFAHLMLEGKIQAYTDSVTNYSKSIVAVLANEIIGFYLFGDRQLRVGISKEKVNKIYISLEEYDIKIGVEGVALVVKDKYRSLGIASKLKDYSKTLGVDYIWGMQYKSLGNLKQWLRRRKLVAENNVMNITVQDF
jgi:predicted double-glycine peptidase